MNANDLRKMLKSLVKECLNEIMNEKYIELVVENKLKETFKPQPVAKENNVPLLSLSELKNNIKQEDGLKQAKPKSIPKSFIDGLGLNSNDPLVSIFEDTASRVNESHLDKKHLKGENEAMSEAQMEEAGILNKNWSRYM